MAHNVCCDSYCVHNMTHVYLLHYCTYIGGQVCDVCLRVVSWDRSSLIGLLVVMSVAAVLVLLVFSFSLDWEGGAGGLSTCSLQSVTASCFGSVASCLVRIDTYFKPPPPPTVQFTRHRLLCVGSAAHSV